MTLRRAIGFSAAFHVVLLTAIPSTAWLAPRQKRFEVSYVPAVSQLRVSNPVPAAPARQVPAAPLAPAPRISTPVSVPQPVQAPRPVSRPITRNDVAVPVARPAVSSLPDKEFVFLDHKEQVRKHLKARLNYPASLTDGTVRIRVILGPEGSFKQAVVLETSDPRLAGLAVKDAQAAAPYPPLPAKFRPRQLRYEFLVRYRPE
ncbi:MAG: energy transducer TonB [Candidatus Omnitrophota bacterium]|nr:energy transducer TonB [Candidatus Omnitrophota bacterium]